MSFLALALAVLAAEPPRWTAAGAPEREAAIEAARRLPLAQRLLSNSEGFLGTPYGVSPLGEGSGKDPDPTLRYDLVDCLTFVEETMAMSLAPTAAQVQPFLQTVRYAKEQTYEDRNHLMEAQWLPNNIAKGYLRDITGELGGRAAVVAEKTLTPHTWSGKLGVGLGLPPGRRALGTFQVPIVPIGQALAAARKAPSGTVVVIVREDRPLLVTRVSHLGFLVQGKRTVLRHASRSWGKVLDEDLEAFLSRNLGYAKWTVSGLAFYEVRDPAAAAP